VRGRLCWRKKNQWDGRKRRRGSKISRWLAMAKNRWDEDWGVGRTDHVLGWRRNPFVFFR
jgi:hypothetical protein